MATMTELISGIEVELEATQKRASRAKAEIKLILDTASQEGRASLSEQEEDRTKELFAAIDLSKAQEQGIRVKLENARRVQAEEDDLERRSQQTTDHAPAPAQNRDGQQRWHVTNEPRTYTRETDRTGKMFLTDVCRQFMYNDVGAASRLSRHMEEERVERGVVDRGAYQERSVGTAAFTGLTVPQYLTELVAPAVANLRPFADICNQHPLPADGMSVNISRITTASGAALQASQNAAVQETNMADTLLTVNVQTAAGQQTVSRQAIDRGTGIEDVVMQDLFSRYYTALDSTLISQATTGLDAVANNNAQATATFAAIYPSIQGAASQVETAMLAMGQPTHVLMHSRRWYWLAGQLSASWPAINSAGMPVQASGMNANAQYGDTVRGVLPSGLQVLVDNNITTVGLAGALTGGTEDKIYVVPRTECHLWEEQGAPAFIRAEQPSAANLGVLLVVYGYFAYSFQRYALGMQKITGAGLAAPAGF